MSPELYLIPEMPLFLMTREQTDGSTVQIDTSMDSAELVTLDVVLPSVVATV
jgi:hypothetical protein